MRNVKYPFYYPFTDIRGFYAHSKAGYSARQSSYRCYNVFDKPSAEGKSLSVCTMPRRENVIQ